MADRGDDAEDGGIGGQHVELAPALVDRAAEPVDAGHVGEVERHQRRLSARRADFVVQLLEPADRARRGDDVRAGRRQFPGQEVADAARRAGDEGDATRKIERIGQCGGHGWLLLCRSCVRAAGRADFCAGLAECGREGNP